MGRFAAKYPTEAKQELCRLAIDSDPPMTVRAAAETIKASHGIEIKLATAQALVRDERRKRRSAQIEKPRELDDRLDKIADQIATALEHESARIRRSSSAAGGFKPLDIDRAKKIATAVKELRAASRPKPSDNGQEPDPAVTSGNGDPPSSVVADLLAAHESATRQG